MTVIELAKLLNTHISQGRGNWDVTLFQWEHGQQSLDAVEARPHGSLDLYSNTGKPAPASEPETGDEEERDGLI